ncbi:MAG: ATP-binding protein [Victivallales bacterium]|nr:ATP-binding protein [Victivallales bacterium]
MREILTELIMDFYDNVLPEMSRRDGIINEMERNASILVGMRRTGKTYRVYQIINELISNGTPLERILYLNLDDDRLDGMTLQDLSLVPEIFYEAHPENHQHLCFFFLDEIQDVDKWEVFVRRIIDSGKIQVFLTGSSSKLLSKEISTVMRGRSVETEMFPLSLAEFMRFHSIMDSIPPLLGSKASHLIKNALDRYFQIGGFPEVQNCSAEVWAAKLQGYANEVLFRDVVERYGITNVSALKYIMLKAFHNPCGKMSANALYNELKSNNYKVDRESIRDYITCFCKAYMFYSVPYHSDSMAQRQVNPPKIYLVDIGLIRALNSKRAADRGHLLENLVFLHLRRKNFEIEYLVTRDGFEVDFIAYHKFDREYHLYQVSYELNEPATLERELRALKSAAQYIGAVETTIVTWDTECELENGIRVVPAWKFLIDRI